MVACKIATIMQWNWVMGIHEERSNTEVKGSTVNGVDVCPPPVVSLYCISFHRTCASPINSRRRRLFHGGDDTTGHLGCWDCVNAIRQWRHTYPLYATCSSDWQISNEIPCVNLLFHARALTHNKRYKRFIYLIFLFKFFFLGWRLNR